MGPREVSHDINGVETHEDGGYRMPSKDKLVELAEHELAKALHNYRQITSGKAEDLVGYYALTDAQKRFYEVWAVPRAIDAIWPTGH